MIDPRIPARAEQAGADEGDAVPRATVENLETLAGRAVQVAG